MAEFTASRNNALPYPVYGLPYVVTFPLLDADGDPVSPSSPDSEISKNGDTFADCTNEAVEIATSSGICYLSLTATELTTDIATVRIQSTGAKTTVLTLIPRKLVTIRSGTSASGGVSTSTVVLDGSASPVDDYYNGMIVAVVIDGTTEVRMIGDYVGSTQTATIVGPDWNTAPDNNDTFVVYLPEGVQMPDTNVRAISDDKTAADNLETACDNYSATRGLAGTALPAAAADAAGGLPISDAGGLDLDTQLGRLDAAVTTRLAPTTAGRTLDVTTGGCAGIDWANVEAPTTTLALTGTTIATTQKVDVETIKTQSVTCAAGVTVYAHVGTSAASTAQTGDAFAYLGSNLGALGANATEAGGTGDHLTAVPWNAAWDAEVQSEVDDALVARNLDKLVLASGTADSGSTTTLVDAALTQADADWWKGRLLVFTSGTLAGQCAIITDFNAGTDTLTFAPAVTAAVSTHTYVILPGVSVWDDTLAEHLASGTTGNALNAAGSAGDPWSTSLPGAYGAGTAGFIVGTNLDAAISSRMATYTQPTGFLAATFPTTVASTTNITAGTITTVTNLTNAPTSGDLTSTMKASVNAEVDTAIADARLDELLAADSNINGAAPPTVGSVFHELMTKTTGSFTFDQTTDSLEAIRDRGDAAWITATGFSTHSAADVWSVATRVLTAGTNIQLPSNGLANVTSWTVAITGNITGNLSGSVGSVTGAVGSVTANVNAVLANTAHGGTSATLRLGSSSSTPALYITNSAGDAVEFQVSAGNGHALHLAGLGNGNGLYCQGGYGAYFQGDTTSGLYVTGAAGQTALDIVGVSGGVGLATTSVSVSGTATLTGAVTASSNSNDIDLGSSERNNIATALLDLSAGIETGVTPRQALRAMAAILAGIVSGAGSGTEVFKAIAATSGGTTRVTVTVDSSGNRSALTLNL